MTMVKTDETSQEEKGTLSPKDKLASALAAQETEEGIEATQTDEQAKEAPSPQEVKEEKLDPKIMSRIKTEADKRVKSYQEKREADTALIRKLTDENRELKRGQGSKKANSLIQSILSEDIDSGLSAEESKTRESALKEFANNYDTNFTEVEEAANFIKAMTAQLPKDIVKDFGLDDPNISIRAVNGIQLLDETAAVYKYNQNFLMAIEEFLPKGSEVRQQIEDLVKGMADYEGNNNAKKLYIADQMKGLKVTPWKKLPVPSASPGGKDFSKMSAKEKIAEGLRLDGNQVKVGGK